MARPDEGAGHVVERGPPRAVVVVHGDERDDRGFDGGQGGQRTVREHRLHGRGEGMGSDAEHDLAGRDLHDGGPGGRLLVGIPGGRIEGPAIGQVGAHRPEHLGRLLDRMEELGRVQGVGGGDILPAAIDQHEACATVAEASGRPGRDHRPEPVPDEDDPLRRLARPDRRIDDRLDVGCQGRGLVAVGRRVRQAVTAEVQRHDPPRSAQAAGHRRPRLPGLGDAVDEHDRRRLGPAGSGGAGRRSPVQEVEPDRVVDRDEVAGRFG